MGIFDGISSALGASAMGPVGAIGGALVSGAASLLGGQNANAQNYQSGLNNFYYNTALMGQQNQLNADAATTAWNRNVQGTATAWDRDVQMLDWNQKFAEREVANQQAYNTQMANTAYQRSVADMKAAGLNPILGVSSGGAASPPISAPTSSGSGPNASSASPSSVSGSSVGQVRMQDVIGPAITNALQGAKLAGAVQEQQLSNANLSKTGEILDENKNKAYWDAIAARYGALLTDQKNKESQSTARAADAQAALNEQAARKREEHGTGTYGNIVETLDAAGKSTGIADYLNNLILDQPTNAGSGAMKWVSPNFKLQQIIP